MGDFKAKLRAKFSRRNSAAPSLESTTSSSSNRPVSAENAGTGGGTVAGEIFAAAPVTTDNRTPKTAGTEEPRPQLPRSDSDDPKLAALLRDAAKASLTQTQSSATVQPQASDMSGNDLRSPTTPGLFSISEHSATLHPPDEATPRDATSSINESTDDDDKASLVNPGLSSAQTLQPAPDSIDGYFTPLGHASPQIPRPSAPPRRQSLLPDRQTTLIQTLLHSEQADELGLSGSDHLLPINASMMTRKIWVKRPSASATLVTINEDDLVDDVRDMILRKYANSLGRQFDAPDLTLRIVPREQRQERALAPDEPMGRTLDAYFPGGQTVDEALIIDIPLRRTPRASPRGGPPQAGQMASFYYDDLRPVDPGTDYFGPGAVAQLPVTLTAPSGGSGHSHSISILNTGQIPQIPSPGGTRSRPYRERDRPQLGRHNTASPTVLSIGGATITVAAGPGTQPAYFRAPRPRTHSSASTDHPPGVGITASPMHTPPGADGMPMSAMQRASTPPPRGASPRPNANPRSKKKKMMEPPNLPAGMLNGGVPPINVLIVEDNIINLKLLEAFVKRLKVRWQTAMNGREAVNKWRAGGFHLVLMDIQLPVMSGLDATREIRRLERINSIGVFSSGASNPPEEAAAGEPAEEDRLVNKEMLKSPVIIVALTASSLQSDRHEALAAGCNDFLTKPVNFVWLERKVMEWGCMQALIDFDGWRKWKDFSQQDEDISASKKALLAKAKTKKNRQSLSFTS